MAGANLRKSMQPASRLSRSSRQPFPAKASPRSVKLSLCCSSGLARAPSAGQPGLRSSPGRVRPAGRKLKA
eukprot:7693147-Heterocapsa_arctica.AAC.2